MAVSNEIVSQKFNNYNYAPGIATYGIDGKIGQSGENGNNFYFTDLDLNDNEGLRELISLIINNRLPLRNSTVELKRKYQNGDLFIDYTGIIYELTDINNLNVSNTDTYKSYFSIAGKINTLDVNNYFDWVGQRLVLNSSYSGYDVITGISSWDASSYIDKNAVVNIISGNIDENDNIEMIRMKSIDSIDVEDGDFSLYYKTTENAYYFDSNKPIIINSDLKVLNNNNVENEYDNYSTVLTSNDTVTYFKHICDKLRYNIIYDSSVNQYKLVIYSNEENENDQRKTLEYLINRNESVFGKIYSGNNEQVLIPLENYIDTSINSKNYYDYEHYNLNFSIGSKHEFTFRYYYNGSYRDVDVPVEKFSIEKTQNNGILNIDVSLNLTTDDIGADVDLIDDINILNGIFNSSLWAFLVSLDSDSLRTNILDLDGDNRKFVIRDGDVSTFRWYKKPIIYSKRDIIYNNLNLFMYSINRDFSKFEFMIFPKIISKYGSGYEYLVLSSIFTPIIEEIKVRNNSNIDIDYNNCALYFTLDYSEEKFSIKNIMLGKRNDLLEILEASKPCILAYIPSNIESVYRVSLLHNTEIFIQNEY